MKKQSSGLDDFLTQTSGEETEDTQNSKRVGFLRRWWKSLGKNDRRFFLAVLFIVLVAVGILVFSAITKNQAEEEYEAIEVEDVFEEEPSEEIEEDLEETESVSALTEDELKGDELYAYLVENLRKEWGDGSAPKLTSETSTNSLIYSFENVTDLPNINELYAKVSSEDVDSGMGGVNFYTSEGKPVVSFYLDDTAIRHGDQGFLRVSRVTFHSLLDHKPKRLPLSNRMAATLKTDVNKMAKSLFSPTAKSRDERWAKYKKLFVDRKVVSEDFLPVAYYEPLYLFIDYAEPANGIYVKCQPSLGRQAMLVKYVQNPDSQAGYLIESVKLAPLEMEAPDIPADYLYESP